jgi:hypothetical protein
MHLRFKTELIFRLCKSMDATTTVLNGLLIMAPEGTIARDFRPPVFLLHQINPPGLDLKLILNIKSNSLRYSNSKVIPHVIRIRKDNLFQARAKITVSARLVLGP